MPTLLIERDSEDKPIRRCPFHKGLAGFVNIGGKFCIHDLDFYDVQSAEESAIQLLAVEHNCNPWTIIECIRVMKELHK